MGYAKLLRPGCGCAYRPRASSIVEAPSTDRVAVAKRDTFDAAVTASATGVGESAGTT